MVVFDVVLIGCRVGLRVKLFVFMVLFCGLLLVVPNSVLAQRTTPLELQWSKTCESFDISSLIQAQDGGFIIAGSDTTSYPPVGLLMKINYVGEVEWAKTYPEIKGVQRATMQVTNLGYFSLGSNSYQLIKTDSQGNIKWSKTIDLPYHASTGFGKKLSGAITTEDDSYVLLEHSSAPAGHYGVSVLKYGAYNALLWEKEFEQTAGFMLQTNSTDSYYIAGTQNGGFWFVKLDLDGNVVWNRVYNYKSPDSVFSSFYSGIQTQDGGFLLSGFDYESSWFVKTDYNGREQWHKRYDCSNMEYRRYGYRILDIVQDKSGQYLALTDAEIVVMDIYGKEL